MTHQKISAKHVPNVRPNWCNVCFQIVRVSIFVMLLLLIKLLKSYLVEETELKVMSKYNVIMTEDLCVVI